MGSCASRAPQGNKVWPVYTSTPTDSQYAKRISALLESSPGGNKLRTGRRNSFIASRSIEIDVRKYDDAKMVAALNEYAKNHVDA